MNLITDTIIHRWLRFPYTLNVRKKRILQGAKVTYLFIHGLGDTGDMWNDVLPLLPEKSNFVVVDLLGFGESPRPVWGKYNAHTQARSVLATYLRLGIRSSVVVIGHSLGALVAVEFARRYPLLTTKLVLCSPPIYDEAGIEGGSMRSAELLRRIYRDTARNPRLIVDIYALGKKLKVLNPSLDVTDENIAFFIANLKASILNQRAVGALERIKLPVIILDGYFDILTIRSTLKRLAKQHANITLKTIPTGHTITKKYAIEIAKLLKQAPTKK